MTGFPTLSLEVDMLMSPYALEKLRVSIPRQGPRPYVLAIVAVVLSAATRFALDPLLHDKAPLLMFVCGIVIAVIFGGLRAGIAATILTIPVCDYLFIQPRYTFFIYDAPGDSISLGVFLVLGVGVSVIIERFHQTRERLRNAHQELQRSELRLRTLAATAPEMLFTANPDGVRDYFSEGFCEYTGLEPERARAEWPEVIHPDERQLVLDQWAKSSQTGAEFTVTYRMRRSDGEYRWFQGHAKPVRVAAGEIVQWTGVATDIHEQKLLAEALAHRTEQLIASNEEFQKFAYRVSHDLKEPLRMIGVFTEFLVKRNQDHLDAESRTFTKYILEGVGRIENHMRDLLEYAKAGSLEIRAELVDFDMILDSAIDNLRSTIMETGATVTHDRLPSLVVNPDRMRSVFQNLIGNALKYRGTVAPRIHISARQEDLHWVFTVRDNGIGFDMSEARRIFTAFERLPSDAKIQGSGLGLAIVKRIVELKGGRIWAESEVGTGSTFFFTLPRSLEKVGAVQARSQAAGSSGSARAS